MSKLKEARTVFVTVGTTQFDDLINSVLHTDTLEILHNEGYTNLVMQIGRGAEPQVTLPHNIDVTWYSLKESISEDIERASLVISHGGSGTCLEVLNAGKPLIVVVNQKLMGNHQQELAEKLHNECHALMCYPNTLTSTLTSLKTVNLRRYPKCNPHIFTAYVDRLMGFQFI